MTVMHIITHIHDHLALLPDINTKYVNNIAIAAKIEATLPS